MEQSDKIFGAPCTTSAMPSFSAVAASRLLSNPFAAGTTATTVVSISSVFNQSPAFSAKGNTVTSSTSLPFARFNFNASSFPSQNSTFSSTFAGAPSFQSTSTSTGSGVQFLFGKPVRDEPKREQSEQEVKTVQPSQSEPKRRWNAKSGNFLVWFAEKYKHF